MASVRLKVSGMHCGNCQAKVEQALKKVAGTWAASVDLKSGTAEVDFDAAQGGTERFVDAVQSAGYQAQVAGGDGH